jgi:hypothetical protein
LRFDIHISSLQAIGLHPRSIDGSTSYDSMMKNVVRKLVVGAIVVELACCTRIADDDEVVRQLDDQDQESIQQEKSDESVKTQGIWTGLRKALEGRLEKYKEAKQQAHHKVVMEETHPSDTHQVASLLGSLNEAEAETSSGDLDKDGRRAKNGGDKQEEGTGKSGGGTSPESSGSTVVENLPKPFDCNSDKEAWVDSWSIEKKAYCCRFENVGCPESSDNRVLSRQSATSWDHGNDYGSDLGRDNVGSQHDDRDIPQYLRPPTAEDSFRNEGDALTRAALDTNGDMNRAEANSLAAPAALDANRDINFGANDEDWHGVAAKERARQANLAVADQMAPEAADIPVGRGNVGNRQGSAVVPNDSDYNDDYNQDYRHSSAAAYPMGVRELEGGGGLMVPEGVPIVRVSQTHGRNKDAYNSYDYDEVGRRANVAPAASVAPVATAFPLANPSASPIVSQQAQNVDDEQMRTLRQEGGVPRTVQELRTDHETLADNTQENHLGRVDDDVRIAPTIPKDMGYDSDPGNNAFDQRHQVGVVERAQPSRQPSQYYSYSYNYYGSYHGDYGAAAAATAPVGVAVSGNGDYGVASSAAPQSSAIAPPDAVDSFAPVAASAAAVGYDGGDYGSSAAAYGGYGAQAASDYGGQGDYQERSASRLVPAGSGPAGGVASYPAAVGNLLDEHAVASRTQDDDEGSSNDDDHESYGGDYGDYGVTHVDEGLGTVEAAPIVVHAGEGRQRNHVDEHDNHHGWDGSGGSHYTTERQELNHAHHHEDHHRDLKLDHSHDHMEDNTINPDHSHYHAHDIDLDLDHHDDHLHHAYMETEPYECQKEAENWESGWLEAKKEWCCRNKNIACKKAMVKDDKAFEAAMREPVGLPMSS